MPRTSRNYQFQRACSCGCFRSRQCLMLESSRPEQITQPGHELQTTNHESLTDEKPFPSFPAEAFRFTATYGDFANSATQDV